MATSSRESSYWLERALLVEEAMNNRGVEYFNTLESAYLLADKNTREKIAALYGRLAENNDISLSGARKLLDANELKEFKWEIDEYIEKARQWESTGAWAKELENASLKYRISRLEAMRIHMQNYVEVVMGNEMDGVNKLMLDMYTESYYKNAHMVQTAIGVGRGFAAINHGAVEKVLSKPWLPDGRNFSERIWGIHRPQLINDLHTGLSQALIRGESYKKLAAQISKKYGVAIHKAETLVMTEGAYFTSLAQQDSYKEHEVEYQQFSAVLDLRTSEICRSMDGRVFKTSDVKIGVNAPPLHPRCRSIMIPHFEGNIKERVAKGADGKTVTISGNLSYQEWYDKFVENNS